MFWRLLVECAALLPKSHICSHFSDNSNQCSNTFAPKVFFVSVCQPAIQSVTVSSLYSSCFGTILLCLCSHFRLPNNQNQPKSINQSTNRPFIHSHVQKYYTLTINALLKAFVELFILGHLNAVILVAFNS